MKRCISCKTIIALRYVTCHKCWWRLPLDMRERFSISRDEQRGAVLIEIIHWLKNNPEEPS